MGLHHSRGLVGLRWCGVRIELLVRPCARVRRQQGSFSRFWFLDLALGLRYDGVGALVYVLFLP